MNVPSLKDLMVPISEYATVSKDANVFEAVTALDKAQKEFDQNRYRHRAVLVLDREGRVVGKLSQHDIIQALEPARKKLNGTNNTVLDRFGFGGCLVESVREQYTLWHKPLDNICEKADSQTVGTYMYRPGEDEYIEETASVNEGIRRLITGRHHSLLITRGKKITGILRLSDIFEYVCNEMASCEYPRKREGETMDTDRS